MVLGTDRNFQGGMPYSDDLLTAMVKLLPPQSIWCLSAIGPAQLPGTTRAMMMGGHVRVGLEDNLYLRKGVKATNAQLVEQARTIVEAMGARVATPDDAREILQLKARS
jgi:3-keto-5-aminohexanoate cleavage enzyme